jgi:murein DD-endopeptidase MepM/ murein hydrolase activator NlpD
VFAGITSERPSLSAALDDQGENIYLALKLADAFSGLVDFNSDLQAGDEFKVLFDRIYRNGQPSGYGDLRAAVLENDGRTFTAIPFELDGRVGWYDADGRSLKRQFLKSPLPFQTTVSSGFSYRRLHPVTGNFAAHPAVDYRAPYGAPVVAIAGGKVVSASYAGNSGNLVVIRHDGGYESMYLHLSAFKVRTGERVQQGETIGLVGNTGRVTATHLDFRIRRNGSYLNPVTLFRSLPPGDPIPASRMASFVAERDRLLGELAARALMTVPTTRAVNLPND